MDSVDYSNEFVISFKDGSIQNMTLHSFTHLIYNCNSIFSDVVSIKRLPMAEI